MLSTCIRRFTHKIIAFLINIFKNVNIIRISLKPNKYVRNITQFWIMLLQSAKKI